MGGNKGKRGEVSWQVVKNTLPNRMTNDSLENNLYIKSRMKKRTKIVNSTIRRYSRLKSYKQYLDIKRSLLKQISVNDESDCEISIKSKIPTASYRNLSSDSSTDDEDEFEYYQYDDEFIDANPKLSLSEKEDENFNGKSKPSKTWTENKSAEIRSSHSASIGEQNTFCRKSVRPSTSGKAALRKSTSEQTKQANFLNKKNISNFKENHAKKDKEQINEKKELSETDESPPLTRSSLRKMSTSLPGSSNKMSVQNRDAQTTKLRNKTRDDVKKNLSTLIGDSETEDLTKEILDKSELNETRHSDLNFSNVMALAQSTQYPDDSSDMSDKPEKKSLVGDFLTTENKIQPKDSGIEEDSTEESAKLKGKYKKVIENKKSPLKPTCVSKYVSNNISDIDNSSDKDDTLCPEIEDSSENQNVGEDETLQNNENACVQSDGDLNKNKHPLKIIASEVVNQKYKIVGKEQEDSTEIDPEERNDEEIDVVGFENCDKSEDLDWKFEESVENGEVREEKHEEKSEQRNIKKEGHGNKKLNIQKGRNEKESEDDIENKNEESDEGLGKIKKFIIKKPIDKKLLTQERYQEQKLKTDELSTKELEKGEDSSGEKSDKENKKAKKMRKEKNRREEKRRLDVEELYSSSESEFEEQDKGKESPNKNQEKLKDIQRNIETKEEKLSNSGKDSESQEDEKKIETQQQNGKIIERRKVEDKKEESSSEEDSDIGEDEKRIEIQQRIDKVEKRRMEEKTKESSSEEDSENEENERRIEIQQQNDKIIRRKVEEKDEKSSSEEDSESGEDEEKKEVQQKKEKVEGRRKMKDRKENQLERRKIEEKEKYEDKKGDSSETEEEKDERDDYKDQEKEELKAKDEVILNVIEKSITEKENSESCNTEKLETENEDSNEEDNSRQIFTQIVDRESDYESEQEKQDEEELKLTLEDEENYVNLDDNNITIEEHKIEIPENHDAKEDAEEEEEGMSAESVKKLQQIKKLNFTLGSDSSSSDEEFSQAQVNRFKNLIRKEKLDSSDSESEEDVKKKSPKKEVSKSPKKKQNLQEKSPTKKKISEEVIESEEDVKKKSPKKEVSKSPKKKQNLQEKSPTKKKISEEVMESEEDVKKKSPKTEVSKSPKKKQNLQEKSPTRKTSEDAIESSDESKEDEKKKTEEVIQQGESDADFDNYIQEGILFLKKQKDEKHSSSSQIIEDVETQNLESSQLISDPDSQICLNNEKKVSKKNREKEIETECINYALSSLERKNKGCSKEIEHQIVLKETQTFSNNENADVKNWKKMTELKELVERDNLIEQNFSSTINLQDISDSEEVWMIQIPKKEISTDLVGKKFSYNGSELKLGENSFKASERKLQSLTCIFNSLGSKRPYKTVNIRPVGCVTVGPKNVSNTLPTEKKKRKISNVQDSLVNVSTEEVHTESDISRKQKKKKLFNEDSILTPKDYKLTDHKLGDNKIKSFHVQECVNAGSKRKRNYFLSESEEEERVEPKVDIKRKKKWDINEYALDEKPAVDPLENLSVKKPETYKQIHNESDSSSELWKLKKKSKKEKQKKKQLTQLNIIKPKAETSSIFSPKIETQKEMLNNSTAKNSFIKVKKYTSLDVSKVKVKNNKEHIDTDSSLINERIKNEKHKKKKKLDNWNVEKVSESEIEEKLQTKIDIKSEEKMKKKKSRRDSEKLNNFSTGNKIDKTTEEENLNNSKLPNASHKSKEEILNGQDFSSDFEDEDKMRSKKKLKKKSCFQNIFNREGVKKQEEVKPKKEKTKKKMQGFIDFEH